MAAIVILLGLAAVYAVLGWLTAIWLAWCDTQDGTGYSVFEDACGDHSGPIVLACCAAIWPVTAAFCVLATLFILAGPAMQWLCRSWSRITVGNAYRINERIGR